MKVFLTGATGFVGTEILSQLIAAGHSVRILSRNPSAAKRHGRASSAVEYHFGNILDAATLTDSCEGVDAVIHLVGIISEIGRNTFEAVHADGTRHVLEAAKASGVKRFVQMSALGARADAASRYHRSKAAAEESVRTSGISWTIFRPSIIYGPNDQFVNMFERMSRWSPVMPIIGSGRNKMQPIPVRDVARCFAGSLTEARSINSTFDLCGPAPLMFEEIIDCILETVHRRRIKIHLPIGLARMQAAMLEKVFPIMLGKAPPLNRDQLLMLGEDNIGNPAPANQLFGLTPVSFREGIATYLC